MICKECENTCLCATCVYNPQYAVNTPKPCLCTDCDICHREAKCYFCDGYMSLEDLDKKVKEMENME